ncbi:MAG: CPBP family intramembrane metalloprotease [Ruminococcaceae bacterium]|nr:CPBP family intramembrane metalloprotease [Oscillospiraceae bacterium]
MFRKEETYKTVIIKIAICMIFHLAVKELLGFLFALVASGSDLSPSVVSIYNTVLYALMMLAFLGSLMLCFKIEKRELLAPFAKSDPSSEPFVIFSSIANLMLVSLLMGFVTAFFENMGIKLLMPESDFPYAKDEGLAIALYFIMVVILAGVLEEMVFRCIIMGRFLKYGEGCAVVVSALLFALVHIYPGQVIFAFICGLIIAKADIRCGSARVGMAIHMLNNFISVVISSMVSFYGEEKSSDYTIHLLFIIFLLGIISTAVLKTKKRRYAFSKEDDVKEEVESKKTEISLAKVILHPAFIILYFVYALYAWWCFHV